MAVHEAELKQQLKSGELLPLYVLYGEETYLTAHYASKIAALAVPADEQEFNLQRLDGQSVSLPAIVEAAETLPLFAERRAVVVSDVDIARADAQTMEGWLAFLADLPDTCVLVIWTCAVAVDLKKNDKWKKFLAAAAKVGMVAELTRPTAAEAARLVIGGAKKRGCVLAPATADLLVSRCGTDMHTLLSELSKLCAAAGEGAEITPQIVTAMTVESLEVRVFDLSKAVWQGNAARALSIVRALQTDREKPTMVLSVLSGAYVDMYRAKVAVSAGERAESLATVFSYQRREFVLRNAARDVARVPIEKLRAALCLLADADRTMKSSSVDKWFVLERTVSELMLLFRR